MEKNNPTLSIEEILDQKIEEKIKHLTKEDVQFIVNELIPKFDELIAERVKTHFYELGKFLTEKFDPGA